MANRQANPVIGVAVVVAVVIVALMIGQQQGRLGVSFCLLLGLIAIELANVYLAVCLYNCGPDNQPCQTRCFRRYLYIVNVLFLFTFFFCVFAGDKVFP